VQRKGELGRGTVDYVVHQTPAKVPGLSNVVAVAGGYRSVYALKSDGTVWAWGTNHRGQLGNGKKSTSTISKPAKVSGLSKVVAIGAAKYSAYAVKSDGTVWAWGSNGDGQLGDGTPLWTIRYRATAGQVSGLTNVTGIAGGGNGFAIAVQGKVAG
jgi:alpha-tubulin suppressor-like RCC1 family protein